MAEAVHGDLDGLRAHAHIATPNPQIRPLLDRHRRRRDQFEFHHHRLAGGEFHVHRAALLEREFAGGGLAVDAPIAVAIEAQTHAPLPGGDIPTCHLRTLQRAADVMADDGEAVLARLGQQQGHLHGAFGVGETPADGVAGVGLVALEGHAAQAGARRQPCKQPLKWALGQATRGAYPVSQTLPPTRGR